MRSILSLALVACAAAADDGFAWGGVFETEQEPLKLILQSPGGSYPTDHLKVVLLPTHAANEAELHEFEPEAMHGFESDDCPEVESGGILTPDDHGEHACYILHLHGTEDQIFNIPTAGVPYLAIYTDHDPHAFEDDTHYLQHADGHDVEPAATIGPATEDSHAGHNHGEESESDSHAGHNHGGRRLSGHEVVTFLPVPFLAIFAENDPHDFEDTDHYLQDLDGNDIEPVATKTYPGKPWGVAIGAAIIVLMCEPRSLPPLLATYSRHTPRPSYSA